MDRRKSGNDSAAAAEDRQAKREAQQAERQLHAHFAGRRDAQRIDTLIECRMVGERGVFRALAVDLSRTGALVRVTDRRFMEGYDDEALMQFSFRVGAHFADGMEIAFIAGSLIVVAHVVRVTSRIEEDTQRRSHLIGIRFRTELSERECESLGIQDEDDAPLPGYLSEE